MVWPRGPRALQIAAEAPSACIASETNEGDMLTYRHLGCIQMQGWQMRPNRWTTQDGQCATLVLGSMDFLVGNIRSSILMDYCGTSNQPSP